MPGVSRSDSFDTATPSLRESRSSSARLTQWDGWTVADYRRALITGQDLARMSTTTLSKGDPVALPVLPTLAARAVFRASLRSPEHV